MGKEIATGRKRFWSSYRFVGGFAKFPGSQPPDPAIQVARPGHGELQRLGGERMYQTKRVGVQRLAWSAAEVLHRLAVQRSVVDRFSTDAMPSFRKVDANLVGATCLQLAFDHRVLAASEGLHRFDMRDGMLCRWIFGRSASSDSITPIAHQHALDRLGCNLAMDHGAIATIDSVVPKELL